MYPRARGKAEAEPRGQLHRLSRRSGAERNTNSLVFGVDGSANLWTMHTSFRVGPGKPSTRLYAAWFPWEAPADSRQGREAGP